MENNHWIGYSSKLSNVFSNIYFKEALDLSENKEVPLLDPNFVTHLVNNLNVMSKVSKTQMQKINNDIIASNRYPEGIIFSVHWSENFKRWQGKTVVKKVVRLANDWFNLKVAC